MRIPYGKSSFSEIRRGGYFCADKTPFLPQHAWMLEVKYLQTKARPAEIERAFEQAYTQLQRTTSDKALVPLLTLGNVGSASPSGAHGKDLRAGALVFVGARDVLFRPWPRAPLPAEKPARKKGAGKRRTGAAGRS